MKFWAAILAIALVGCSGSRTSDSGDTAAADTVRALPDTLRVATLYSPTSYFIYRDTPMGYDYSLLMSMAEAKGLAVDLKVASSMADAMEMLDSGRVDLISYEIPITSEYKEKVIHCGPVNTTSQVLVQPAKRDTLIRDVTQLIGKDVYVEAGSKYQQRISNLNDELGGGIHIHPVERDTLITEDLIEMVDRGEIALTIVDSDIARINKTYYPGIDVTTEVSFPQRSAWAVNKSDQWLADSIDAWINDEQSRKANDQLLKRYFELSKTPPPGFAQSLVLKGGRASPYDALFRAHAKGTNIDWRLLAAICYVESGFNNDATSWAGAKGIMQIMPGSARAYGTNPADLIDPDVSIATAVRIFSDLDRSLARKVPDREERIKFILASYNAGMGHVFDAIEIAKATGRSPVTWFGNVETALTLKSKPEYYNQPYCRNGYFKSGETVNFVHKVLDTYTKIKTHIAS